VFDARRYQIFCVAVGLGTGPLNLVRITDELPDRNVVAPVKKTEINGLIGHHHAYKLVLRGNCYCPWFLFRGDTATAMAVFSFNVSSVRFMLWLRFVAVLCVFVSCSRGTLLGARSSFSFVRVNFANSGNLKV
jgi:hypothetical protein